MAIVGPAGGGKTFFMQCLAGETKLTVGSCIVSGRIYYMPENCYFTEDTILQNIICGQPYDTIRYQEIIDSCKLEILKSQLHHEDRLILKDNGTNIYTKLRKRIMIARLLYAIDSYDIVLIDSFFDDLDKDNREYLIDTIVKDRLKDKTVFVATDQIDVCRKIGHVVVLKEGRIVQCGTYGDLAEDRAGLFRLLYPCIKVCYLGFETIK